MHILRNLLICFANLSMACVPYHLGFILEHSRVRGIIRSTSARHGKVIVFDAWPW